MEYLLSEANTELVENFIATNTPYSSDYLPNINNYYREDAIKYWKMINDPNIKPTTYLPFADNAGGFTNYGFYKSKKGEIFLIDTYCNKLTAHYNVNSNWCLLIPRDEYEKKQNDALLYVD